MCSTTTAGAGRSAIVPAGDEQKHTDNDEQSKKTETKIDIIALRLQDDFLLILLYFKLRNQQCYKSKPGSGQVFR